MPIATTSARSGNGSEPLFSRFVSANVFEPVALSAEVVPCPTPFAKKFSVSAPAAGYARWSVIG